MQKINSIFIGQRSHQNEKFRWVGGGSETTILTPLTGVLIDIDWRSPGTSRNTHGAFTQNVDKELVIPKIGLFDFHIKVKVISPFTSPASGFSSGTIGFRLVTPGISPDIQIDKYVTMWESQKSDTVDLFFRDVFSDGTLPFKIQVSASTAIGGDFNGKTGMKFSHRTLITESEMINNI